MQSNIKTLHEQFIKNEIKESEFIKDTKEKALKNQEMCNSFVTIMDQFPEIVEFPTLLSGIPYGLKDNISTKGVLTTASSNTLKNYIPVYDATIYEKLNQNGAVMIGKTTLDEFGMGGTGTTGHTGIVKNPWNTEHQAGGSSAGSAASVAAGVYPFAIGTDTGDSIRKPAAYCGIVGYKPTYGMVSRYGLLPYASSLDHIGVLTRSVYDAAIVIDAIKGKDEKDMTSFDSSKIHLVDSLENQTEKKPTKLFYIKEIADITSYENPSDELKKTLKLFQETVEKAKEIGMTVDEVSIDQTLLNAIPTTYDCISYAESTSNLSNMTGIPFGVLGNGSTVTEQMIDHRSKGFSSLIKRRFVIGSYVLQKENQEKYFVNACRVRHLVVDKINEYFKTYDALLLPCSEGGAKYLDETKNKKNTETKVLENHLVIGNFGGFPSITIPNGFVNELPVGINLTAKIKDDANLLKIAYQFEEKLGFFNQIAGGEKK